MTIKFQNTNILSYISVRQYIAVDDKEPKNRRSGALTYDDQTLEMVRGQRGKFLLSYFGFLYARNNQTNGSVYWCCRTKLLGQPACKARITTTEKENGLYRICVTQPFHNHSPTNRMLKKFKTDKV